MASLRTRPSLVPPFTVQWVAGDDVQAAPLATEMSSTPAGHRLSCVPSTTYERRAKIRKLSPSIFEISSREGEVLARKASR